LVGTLAIPVASVKSSAAATEAMMVTFFMAIFRKAQGVGRIQMYEHRSRKAVMRITSTTGFDIYVMAITSSSAAMC
jgi:hypothetical protein